MKQVQAPCGWAVSVQRPMHNLLALDQSSRTSGWAVFIDGKLTNQGNFTVSQDDFGVRLHAIREKVKALIKQYNITEIVFEDIQLQSSIGNNVDTFKKLAEVFGIILELSIDLNIPAIAMHPTSWRSAISLKGKTRTEQKKAAQAHVAAKYNLKVSEDTSDAICIGEAFLRGAIGQLAADYDWDS